MASDLQLLTPWIILSSGILATILVSVVRVESKRPAQITAFLTLVSTLISSVSLFPANPHLVLSGALEVSPLSQGALAAMCLLAGLFIIGTGQYLTRERIHFSDYYHLLLILVLGASVMVAAKNLIIVFIALEVMSLPAYTLTGFRRNDSRSNEAALKYFVLGGAMGAVFLLGSSFIFGATGTLNVAEVFSWSKTSGEAFGLFQVGHVLLMVAFLFKVAAAPVHFWKPDVYEGAPTPVVGVMTTVVTLAAFLTLIRIIHMVDFQAAAWAPYSDMIRSVLRVAAMASLLIGSTVMITQRNLKRMLAYSSITHSGYLLLGILGSFNPSLEVTSVLIYLVGYCAMSVGVFVLLSLSQAQADTGTELIDLTGLMKRAPFLTILWSVFLFSMAGMPFTVGFFTKYFVFMASLGGGETVLVILAAVCTVIAAYAYIRPLALMVMREPAPEAAAWNATLGSQIVAVVAALAVLLLGIIPNAVIHFLKGIPLIH